MTALRPGWWTSPAFVSAADRCGTLRRMPQPPQTPPVDPDGRLVTATDPAAVMPLLVDALNAAPHRTLSIVLVDDLGPYCAVTDPDSAVIYLDARCTPGEMRATIAHELVHIACPDCGEEEVESRAARQLVPLADAVAARPGDLAAVAERLGVDAALVRARARDMSHPRWAAS